MNISGVSLVHMQAKMTNNPFLFHMTLGSGAEFTDFIVDATDFQCGLLIGHIKGEKSPLYIDVSSISTIVVEYM